VHISRPKIRFRWAIFHVALVIFIADEIAALWPPFAALWNGVSHIAVAGATLLACLFEYLGGIEEAREHRALEAEVSAKAKEASNV